MFSEMNWALVVPMANEEKEFKPFIDLLLATLDRIKSGKVYIVVDNVSIDNTLELCRSLSESDHRIKTIFAPENKNIVDAYIKGYQTAFDAGHEYIIEMDAGLSHDPSALPLFLEVLSNGFDCAFGSRFIEGGSNMGTPLFRRFISKGGTILSNLLLGSSMHDMTSGYQGFHRKIVERFLDYFLHSKAHFYQTELRYLLRNTRYKEVPINYKAPSPSISRKAILNSFSVLFFYFYMRITAKAPSLFP